MKKGILVVTVFFVAFLIIAGIVGKIETRYTRTGIIIETNDCGIAVIKDTTGNLWEVESAELSTGDSVEFRLSTCGTDAIEDDCIEKVWVR